MRVGVGQLLGGRLVVEGRLGEGAAATVWRVREPATGRVWALKVATGDGADARARALREGAVQGALRHPNLVGVHEVLEVDGRPALLMDHVAGETLAVALRDGGLPIADADAIAAGLFAGLGAAHAAGVVHRDLKPENVLVGRGRRGPWPRIADFGVAVRPDDPTATPGAGTPRYMAPEQARGEAVDVRADVWALGCVLYELATGRRAFEVADPVGLLDAVMRGDVAPARSARPDLPERWERAIEAALRPALSSRAPSVEAVAALWGAVPPGPDESDGAADPSPGPQPVPGSLAFEEDPFVGRQSELAALGDALAPARLVVVRGPAGVGKTRLAVRFAWENLDRFPGGAWQCGLAGAEDPQGVCRRVAEALGVPLERADAAEQLGDALRARGRCLLFLDAFERAGACAADLVGRWRSKAPEAAFVVTSRVRLDVPDVRELSLDPLSLADGLTLFLDRAQSHRPGFALGDHNRSDLEAIVADLDGLPLAVELAAARVAVLSPAKIRQRLADRFQLLRGARFADPRHATLRAAIDESWALLDEVERRTLALVTVFEGGFSIDDAVAVAGDGARPVIPALSDRSLVRAAGGGRYTLLRNLQEYAAERLRAEGAFEGSGPVAAALAERIHGERLASWGRPEALDGLAGPDELRFARALEADLDNLVVASRRAVARGDGATAVACAVAAWEVLERGGPYALGAGLFEAAVPIAGRLLGRALRGAGSARLRMGEPDAARVALEQAAALAAEGDDPVEECDALNELGTSRWAESRREEALACFERALALSRVAGPRRREAAALSCLAIVAHEAGRLDEAAQLYESAIALHRDGGSRRRVGAFLANLGLVHLAAGRPAAAKAALEEALGIARDAGDRCREGNALRDLARVAWSEGRMDQAREGYERALEVACALGDRRSAAATTGNLGILHAMQGRPEAARASFEEALGIHRDTKNRLSEGVVLGNLAILHRQEGRLDAAEAAFAEALAVHRETGNRLAEGNVLGDLGGLHLARGDLGRARAACEAALAVHRGVGQRGSEGVALVRLAEVLLRDRDFDGAIVALNEAEAALREAGGERVLGELLVVRARARRGAGDLPGAREALASAARCAEAISARRGSALADAIDAARAVIEA